MRIFYIFCQLYNKTCDFVNNICIITTDSKDVRVECLIMKPNIYPSLLYFACGNSQFRHHENSHHYTHNNKCMFFVWYIRTFWLYRMKEDETSFQWVLEFWKSIYNWLSYQIPKFFFEKKNVDFFVGAHWVYSQLSYTFNTDDSSQWVDQKNWF